MLPYPFLETRHLVVRDTGELFRREPTYRTDLLIKILPKICHKVRQPLLDLPVSSSELLLLQQYAIADIASPLLDEPLEMLRIQPKGVPLLVQSVHATEDVLAPRVDIKLAARLLCLGGSVTYGDTWGQLQVQVQGEHD